MHRPITEAEDYAADYALKRLYDNARIELEKVAAAEVEAEYHPNYRAPIELAIEKLQERSDRVVGTWN